MKCTTSNGEFQAMNTNKNISFTYAATSNHFNDSQILKRFWRKIQSRKQKPGQGTATLQRHRKLMQRTDNCLATHKKLFVPFWEICIWQPGEPESHLQSRKKKREGEIKVLVPWATKANHKRKLEGWVTLNIWHCSIKLAFPSGFCTPSETELHKSYRIDKRKKINLVYCKMYQKLHRSSAVNGK